MYGVNNPYRYVDPDGRYVETALEAVSIGVGVQSGLNNLFDGKYFDAAVDVAGVFVDTAGLFVPGGVCAGIGIKAYRASKGTPSLDSLSKAAEAADKGGFTKAGRSLQKHGSRLGSKWNQSDINVNSPRQANSRAQDLVDIPQLRWKSEIEGIPDRVGPANHRELIRNGVTLIK